MLFDVDGTLVHSGRRDSSCFAQAYEEIYQKPFPSLDWHTFPHVTDHIIFGTCIRKHFNRGYSREEKYIFRTRYMSLLQKKREQEPAAFQSVPGAPELIAEMREREELIIAIATGGWSEPAQIKLKHVGIEPDELIISGGDWKETREDIVHDAINRVGKNENVPVDRVVYVGDALWDVITTANLNMDFVGVRHGGDFDVLREAGAEIVLRDFRERDAFFEAIDRACPPNVKKEKS